MASALAQATWGVRIKSDRPSKAMNGWSAGGGYCFEHNGLFFAMPAEFGFDVQLLQCVSFTTAMSIRA
jgi:arylamine N-acetyltransferase